MAEADPGLVRCRHIAEQLEPSGQVDEELGARHAAVPVVRVRVWVRVRVRVGFRVGVRVRAGVRVG